MKIVIRIYSRRTLITRIDFGCLFELIDDTFGAGWDEVCFADMSEKQKKIAARSTPDGIDDVLAPFFIEVVDDDGTVHPRLDLDVRLTHEGSKFLNHRPIGKEGYRLPGPDDGYRLSEP